MSGLEVQARPQDMIQVPWSSSALSSYSRSLFPRWWWRYRSSVTFQDSLADVRRLLAASEEDGVRKGMRICVEHNSPEAVEELLVVLRTTRDRGVDWTPGSARWKIVPDRQQAQEGGGMCPRTNGTDHPAVDEELVSRGPLHTPMAPQGPKTGPYLDPGLAFPSSCSIE